jgi:hypothetical protein
MVTGMGTHTQQRRRNSDRDRHCESCRAHKEVGLDVTSRIFLSDGRGSASPLNMALTALLAQFATFTLHDPVEYKIKAIGDWALKSSNSKTRGFLYLKMGNILN